MSVLTRYFDTLTAQDPILEATARKEAQKPFQNTERTAETLNALGTQSEMPVNIADTIKFIGLSVPSEEAILKKADIIELAKAISKNRKIIDDINNTLRKPLYKQPSANTDLLMNKLDGYIQIDRDYIEQMKNLIREKEENAKRDREELAKMTPMSDTEIIAQLRANMQEENEQYERQQRDNERDKKAKKCSLTSCITSAFSRVTRKGGRKQRKSRKSRKMRRNKRRSRK